jgi:hypothetical protein
VFKAVFDAVKGCVNANIKKAIAASRAKSVSHFLSSELFRVCMVTFLRKATFVKSTF